MTILFSRIFNINIIIYTRTQARGKHFDIGGEKSY